MRTFDVPAGLQLPAGAARAKRGLPGLVVPLGEGWQSGGALRAAEVGGCSGRLEIRDPVSGVRGGEVDGR